MTTSISESSAPVGDLPTVRLKPKANARAIRHGFPWVYANELVTDRRTRSKPAGTLAVLEDDGRVPLGLVALNPDSKIICRMLDRDPQATIDLAWFETRLRKALHLRERVFDAPYYRLVHAEADGLPGVVIDRFGDICVVQPNAAWAETLLHELTDALVAVTGVSHVLKNASGRTRSLEGLDDAGAVLHGSAPEGPITVPMNDAVYMADLTGGQKTGLFDPPAFAPSKPSVDAGLRAYERVARLAATLVAENGILALCSCSHAADLSAFRAACARGIGRSGRRGSLIYTGFAGPDHPQLPQLAESGYLKSIFFQL